MFIAKKKGNGEQSTEQQRVKLSIQTNLCCITLITISSISLHKRGSLRNKYNWNSVLISHLLFFSFFSLHFSKFNINGTIHKVVGRGGALQDKDKVKAEKKRKKEEDSN